MQKTARRTRKARAVAELILFLSQSTSARAFQRGLNPTQWAALRYFNKANPDARTIGAFARVNFSTPGSASQTLRSLTSRGLVIKAPGADRRSRIINLTPRGQKLLEDDPISELGERIARLSDLHLNTLTEALALLTRDL